MRISMLLALLALPLCAEPLTKGERDQAMSHLHATRKQILDFIGPLSEAQWNYKAGPDRWSIAECAEHITETENMLRGLIQKTVKDSPVDDAKRAARARRRRKPPMRRYPPFPVRRSMPGCSASFTRPSTRQCASKVLGLTIFPTS